MVRKIAFFDTGCCSHHFRGYSCNLAIIEGLTFVRKRIAVHFVMMCTSAS